MKDTSVVASRQVGYDRSNRCRRPERMAEVGSSVESSEAEEEEEEEEEDEDDLSSDGNLLLSLDASDSRLSIEGLCDSIVKNETLGDGGIDAVDDVVEPGKFNFQLLPGHCVKGRQGNKMYKCDICGGIYRHAFSLKRHYLRTHINYNYLSRSDVANCNINIDAYNSGRDSDVPSGETTTTTSAATAAIVVVVSASLGRDVYRCHICNLYFDESLHLKDHILNHPNTPSSKRFNCTQCDMTFTHKQNLVRHMSVHSGEKPFPCKHCGKGFPTATNQRRHERIHQGLKPYLCPHCQSHFSQSGDLKKHIRKLHREFFHPCAFCMKYFAHRSELQEHVVSHGKSLEHNHRVLSRKVESNGNCGGGGGGGGSCSSSSSSSGGGVTITVVKPRQAAVEHPPPLPPPLVVVPCSFPRLASSELPRRYRCNVCEKRFHTNVKLQRHRNIAHPQRRSDPRSTTLAVSRRIPRRSPETVQFCEGSRFSEPSPYFANVSQNIAHNLQHYLDGKLKPHNNHFGGGEIGRLGDGEIFSKCRNSGSWTGYKCGTREDMVSNGYMEPFRELSGSCWLISDLPSSEDERSMAVSNGNGNGGSGCKEEGGGGGGSGCKEGGGGGGSVVLDLSVSKVSVITEDDVDGLTFKPPQSMFLCHACGECFASLVEIEEHKVNNHPNVHCTHVEVDNLKDVPLDILRFHCSPEGALQRCPLVPTVSSVANSFKPRCTKCRETFGTSGELHEHILACGGHVDKRNILSGNKLRDPSKRVGKRGMKRRHDMSDDGIFPKRKSSSGLKVRKAKRETGFDWLPTEQQDWKTPEKSTSLSTPIVNSSLSSHNSKKTNDLHLMCDGCNQKFKYISALDRHRRFCLPEMQHRGQKAREVQIEQHSCPYCSRSFTYMASLKKHVAESCPQKDTVEAKEKRATMKVSNQKNKKVQQPPSTKPVTPTNKQNVTSSTSREIPVKNLVATIVEKEKKKRKSSYKDGDDDDKDKKSKEKKEEPVVIKKAVVKEEIAEECSVSLPSSPKAIEDKDEKTPKKVASPVEKEAPVKLPSTTLMPTTESEAILNKPAVTATTTSTTTTTTTTGGNGTDPSSQSCVRQEQHTCPNCKRTFTYLANYKKHLNVLCPLRALKADGGGGGGSGVVGTSGGDQGSSGQSKTEAAVDSDSEEKLDDPEAVVEPATETTNSHKCSICHKSFTEYVEMLKHRLLHKLKTTTASVIGLKISGRKRTERAVSQIPSPPPPSFDDVSGDRLDEVISAHRRRRRSSISSCGSSDEPLVRKREPEGFPPDAEPEPDDAISETSVHHRVDLVFENRFRGEVSEDVDDDFGIEVSKIFTNNSALVESNNPSVGQSNDLVSSLPSPATAGCNNVDNNVELNDRSGNNTGANGDVYSSVVMVDGTSNNEQQNIVLTLL